MDNVQSTLEIHSLGNKEVPRDVGNVKRSFTQGSKISIEEGEGLKLDFVDNPESRFVL